MISTAIFARQDPGSTWFLKNLPGFIIGIGADRFEKLQIVPLMIITPLTFLGGTFYSISMFPPLWQKMTLFNPVFFLVSGFRRSFYVIPDTCLVDVSHRL
jgi:ABC-2 type transport system permease protein